MMETAKGRRGLIEAGVAALLLVLAFIGIAASDVSATGSQTYWTGLVLAFGVAAIGVDWFGGGQNQGWQRAGGSVMRAALHWLGVFVAIQLVYVFIASGRLANADTGLTNGLVLALGAFLAGVHGNWRLLVIGAALGLATACVAYVEEYLWILLGLAVLAILALVLGARFTRRGGRAP